MFCLFRFFLPERVCAGGNAITHIFKTSVGLGPQSLSYPIPRVLRRSLVSHCACLPTSLFSLFFSPAPRLVHVSSLISFCHPADQRLLFSTSPISRLTSAQKAGSPLRLSLLRPIISLARILSVPVSHPFILPLELNSSDTPQSESCLILPSSEPPSYFNIYVEKWRGKKVSLLSCTLQYLYSPR